jgi:hypothetical protein
MFCNHNHGDKWAIFPKDKLATFQCKQIKRYEVNDDEEAQLVSEMLKVAQSF